MLEMRVCDKGVERSSNVGGCAPSRPILGQGFGSGLGVTAYGLMSEIGECST